MAQGLCTFFQHLLGRGTPTQKTTGATFEPGLDLFLRVVPGNGHDTPEYPGATMTRSLLNGNRLSPPVRRCSFSGRKDPRSRTLTDSVILLVTFCYSVSNRLITDPVILFETDSRPLSTDAVSLGEGVHAPAPLQDLPHPTQGSPGLILSWKKIAYIQIYAILSLSVMPKIAYSPSS